MTTTQQVGVLTPAPLLKTVRERLTERRQFGERILKWGRYEEDDREFDLFLVFSALEVDVAGSKDSHVDFDEKNAEESSAGDSEILERLGLRDLEKNERLQIFKFEKGKKPTPPQPPRDIYHITRPFIAEFLQPEGGRPISELTDLLKKPQKYSLYHPLLLLRISHVLASQQWNEFIKAIPDGVRDDAYAAVAKEFNVTHIAVNSPIPTTGDYDENNRMRRPVDIIPLYGGDFGSDDYNEKDFDKALWVSVRQNGIYQTWPPLHVMFSRGNLREKARLLKHYRDTTVDREQCAVVDLYVGIGYFAFSYIAAGASLVLGWDINRWSIEACRRGAEGNGWRAEVHSGSDGEVVNADVVDVHSAHVNYPKIVLFHESNAHAVDRIAAMKGRIPPIAHVNLGILPSSRHSYPAAVKIALLNDPPRPCWVHVHENANEDDLDEMKQNITAEFSQIITELYSSDIKWQVKCPHVERVKSWAPKVFHYVFDINLAPEINTFGT